VFYVGLILLSWLILSGWTDPGLAWTWVHVIHGVVSYYLLHWTKGSPIQSDQGKWDRQVLWRVCAPAVLLSALAALLALCMVCRDAMATWQRSGQAMPYAQRPVSFQTFCVVLCLTVAPTMAAAA
jgi:hypothetical protein